MKNRLLLIIVLLGSSRCYSCSIVGFIGDQWCRQFMLEALERLEYRGYDSAGVAFAREDSIVSCRAKGDLDCLKRKLLPMAIDGQMGIGHMRWATHGGVTEINAHPHQDCSRSIAVVHNGIIENFDLLKKRLISDNHIFSSTTDTEVIAHLYENALKNHASTKEAALNVISHLEGTFATLLMARQIPGTLVAIRNHAPLCIGVGDGQSYIASDPLAFTDRTNKVVFLPEASFAIIKAGSLKVYDFQGNELSISFQEVDAHWKVSDKCGHKHYMLHEIFQQKQVVPATSNFLKGISSEIWQHLGVSPEQVKKTKLITMVGCGTSWHAARIAQFFFESVCNIPAHVYLASEFRYMPFFPNPESLYIFISQSGETADTLEALRLAKSHGLSTIALTNVKSSTMAREAGGVLLTQAGPEIAVASTKAFTTQLTAMYWLAHRIALECGGITNEQMSDVYDHLQQASYALDLSIERAKEVIVQKLAKEFAQFKHIIFLGRHISYPMALEATLKLKEISYIFSQCYPAGELKHGPIALIDQDMPIILFSNAEPLLYQKLLSNAQEVKARGGRLITFAFEDQHELKALSDVVFDIPRVAPLLSPMAMVGVMQFLAYHIAKERGCPIDRPRNLAKSVTVE